MKRVSGFFLVLAVLGLAMLMPRREISPAVKTPVLPAAPTKVSISFQLKGGPIPTESYERDINGAMYFKLVFRAPARVGFSPYLTLLKKTLYPTNAVLYFPDEGSYDLGLYTETGLPEKKLVQRIRIVIKKPAPSSKKAVVIF